MSKHTNAPGAYADQTALKRKRRKVVGIVAAVLSAVLVMAAGIFVVLMMWGNDIYPGVHVGVVDVSGLSRRQAIDAVAAKYSGSAAQQDLIIKVGDQSFTLSAAECPIRYEPERAVTEAGQYGRSGSLLQRIADVWRARRKGISLDLPLTVDDVTLLKQMEAIARAVQVDYRPSGYTYENGELIVDKGVAGYGIDAGELCALVRAHLLAGKTDAVEVSLTMEEPAPLDWDALAALVKTQVREPALDLEKDPTGNTILPGQPGRSLDVTAAKAMVEASENPVSVPILLTDPDMTDRAFQATIFRDVLGSASSTFNPNNQNRTTNVTLAADFCNNTVLMPGEVFSYNAVVGPRTAERGFKEASVYIGASVEDGLGGGICQVTSTLYLATLYADLEIVERFNHSRDVTYVPDGLDATVAWGSKDYRFKNNTEYPIRVQTIVKNGKLTVNIYGTQTVPGKEVRMEVVELSRDPALVKDVLDPTLEPGTETFSGTRYDGYKTQSYRVILINGQEVSRREEAYSSYQRYDYTVTRRYNPAVEEPETDEPVSGADAQNPDGGETVPGAEDETPVVPDTPASDAGSADTPDAGNTGDADADNSGSAGAGDGGSADSIGGETGEDGQTSDLA